MKKAFLFLLFCASLAEECQNEKRKNAKMYQSVLVGDQIARCLPDGGVDYTGPENRCCDFI